MSARYAKRPPSFAVGERFVVKHMGWVFIARVESHEGDKARIVSLPEGGFASMEYQRKPSPGTRAIVSPEEAARLLASFDEALPDVTDRKARFVQLQTALKSLDPFLKADGLGMLARRRVEPGLNADEKALYRQLRTHLQLELAASLGQTDEEADALLKSKGVPDIGWSPAKSPTPSDA